MSERVQAAREVKRLVAESIDRLRGLGYTGDTLTALIAREHLAGLKAMAELREEHRAEELGRAQVAARRIFGADDLVGSSDPATHRASFRDAMDRADSLESSEQASRLLSRALRSGDEILARAVAAKAFDRRWNDVVKDYGETHPQWSDAVARSEDTRLSVGMGANIVFGLKRPPELQHLQEGDVANLVKKSEGLYEALEDTAKATVHYAGGHIAHSGLMPIGDAS